MSLGAGLSNKRCTHKLPRSCVEGCVVLLSEAWGCVSEGLGVRILRAICRAVNCQYLEGAPGW